MEIKPYGSSNVLPNQPIMPANITPIPANVLPSQMMPVSNVMPMIAPQPMACPEIHPQHFGCGCYQFNPCCIPYSHPCHMPIYDPCCLPGISPYFHSMPYPCC